MPSDPSRPGSASLSAREMYSSMNGYMPNGYHGYDTNMYSQSPYASSHMSSSPSPFCSTSVARNSEGFFQLSFLEGNKYSNSPHRAPEIPA